MKRYMLILMAVSAILSMNAKTIHWITFIDTTDPNVGEMDVVGRETLYNSYINLVNAALSEKGYNYVLHDYYGARTSPENCRKVISTLSTAPDDIIMFYYIGHGARAYNDATQWPQMLMAQDDERKFVPLSWVHSALNEKPHRLLVTVGMCCNAKSNISPKDIPNFGVNYGNTYMSDEAIENIARLFLGHKGDLLLSSSKAGEFSLGIGPYKGKTGIDVFTMYLVEAFKYVMSGEMDPDWNTFFSAVGDAVSIQASKFDPPCEQHPQWQPNLQTAELPGNSVPSGKTVATEVSNDDVEEQAASGDTESTDVRNDVINFFNTVFNILIDTRLSDDKRIETCEAFASEYPAIMSMHVKTLGQDGDVVVGRQSMEDFIGRLATSRVLRGVAVSGINNGSMYVREIYRQ